MSQSITAFDHPSTARVVLVGNGPSLLQHAHGAEIDSFDEVVRFNRFKLGGFEQHTGTRTTLWSTFGHGYLPGDDDVRPSRMIYVYGDTGEPAYTPAELHRIPRSFYDQQWERVKAASLRTPEEVAKTGMTSGFVVAMWFLEMIGLQHLTLAGFDHFRKDHSPLHHYYNPRSYCRPPELDGDAEALLLQGYVNQSRVTYL